MTLSQKMKIESPEAQAEITGRGLTMEPCGRPEHRGMGNTSLMFGLYREGEYREKPPNSHRVIIVPLGEPIVMLSSMDDNELPPCPDCGGKLRWAEFGRMPGARECADCGLNLQIHPVSKPDGRPWPWQNGDLQPTWSPENN